MSWKVTTAFVAACLGLFAVLYAGFGRDPRAVPFMLKGKPAPAFTIARIGSGERVTLDQFKGRPLVINFWASWCGPCLTEHPVLERMSGQLADKATFIGVVVEDTEENAIRFLRQNGASFAQHMDLRSSMSVDYGVSGMPETYFIDAAGIIVDKHIGPLDPSTLRRKVEALAAGGPTATRAVTP